MIDLGTWAQEGYRIPGEDSASLDELSSGMNGNTEDSVT